MSFLNNLVNEFTHQGQQNQNQGQGQGQGYGGGQVYGSQGQSGYSGQQPPPPQVSYPWRAVWDARDNRYVFENEQTGQRTFEYPGGGERGRYDQQGGYGQGANYGNEYGQGKQQKPDHHYGGMALAGAAGLAGGALLMHEGKRIRTFHAQPMSLHLSTCEEY